MPQVEFQGQLHEFPDNFTDAQIAAALKSSVTKEEKSVGGFIDNAISSGGRFAGDVASGVVGMGKGLGVMSRMAQGDLAAFKELGDFGRNTPEMLSAIGSGLKDRYGSPGKAWDTFYEDPVGMAADVSSIAGGVGLGAKAARLPGVVSKAAKVERLTNPLTVPGIIAGKVAPAVAHGVIQTALRPDSAIRRTFKRKGGLTGRQTVTQGILGSRATTSEAALKAMADSADDTNKLISNAEALRPGPVIPTATITNALNNGPMDEAKIREQLGHRYQVKGVNDRIAEILKQAVGGGYSLTLAQKLKQHAQRLGYSGIGPTATMNKAIAHSLQEILEKEVKGVDATNETTRQRMAATKALSAAEDRQPSALLSGMAAGVGYGVHPTVGGAIGALGIIQHSPRLGTNLGIKINDLGKLAGNKKLQRAILIARLQAQLEEEMRKRSSR